MVQELVVAEARSWIGTPYRHQASLKQKGCDCIGLIIGIWRELFNGLPLEFKLPVYTPGWAEETKKSQLVEISRQYLTEVAVDDFMDGDVIMYRMLRSAPTKHCAIVSSSSTIIHAYQGHGVIETPFLTHSKNLAHTHTFRFPTEVKWQHKD